MHSSYFTGNYTPYVLAELEQCQYFLYNYCWREGHPVLVVLYLPIILFQHFKLFFHQIFQAEMLLDFQVALYINFGNLV